MVRELTNYAFIDSQNVHQGMKRLGWKLDWHKFRIYLREKYAVKTAYFFIGFMEKYSERYSELQKAGFVLQFKPVIMGKSGEIKGNIDADLVLKAMIEYEAYAKAVIVTSDGDFYSLTKHLYRKNKLEVVLSPHVKTCSSLLKRHTKERIYFMDKLRGKLEYINEKAPLKDGTLRGAFP